MEQIFNFISFNTEIELKVLFTIAFLIVLWLLRRVANAFIRESLRDRYNGRIWFWAGQGLNLVTAVLLILGLLEIWFDNPNRLATAIGLVTAGIAFALQKVITAIAGYFVILRSNIFSVGDRITMGGVRGDVIRQYSTSDVAVTIRLLEAIATIARSLKTRKTVQHYAAMPK